jgi:hypothetical protein
VTLAELERGWVEFRCPVHGFLVATSASAAVKCACGKPAHATRDGQRLHREALKRIKASQNPLQMAT